MSSVGSGGAIVVTGAAAPKVVVDDAQTVVVVVPEQTVIAVPVAQAVVVHAAMGPTGAAGPPGPPGPPGPTGLPGPAGGATYVHDQLAPATLWTIVHNLGQWPSVTVIDSGGNLVLGDVDYLDPMTLTVAFSAAFGGRAFLNS